MKKYFSLFFTMLKIGLFTFGGGYAMIALLEGEFVEKKKYMEKDEFLDMVAIAESTPGPIAINAATYIGTVTAGMPGALSATLGVVLPSFLIILAISRAYRAFRESHVVKSCMRFVKPAAVGLIGAAAVSIGKTALVPAGMSVSSLTGAPFLTALGVFALTLLLALKKVHPIVLILISAAAGLAAGACGIYG